MKENDLIRRGDVLARKEVITEEFHEHGASMSISHSVVTVDNINAIPAVPQQMSAVEYLEAFSRLDGKERHFVQGCVAIGEFDIAVNAVQKWARQHAERSEEDD